jgi:serine/threonine-protein phosphatase 2A regulatory subunit A
MCLQWLNDPVYSIRQAAVVNLKELTQIFGSPWAERNLIVKLLGLKDESNYLHRLTALFGMAEMSKVLTADAMKKNFVPAL